MSPSRRDDLWAFVLHVNDAPACSISGSNREPDGTRTASKMSCKNITARFSVCHQIPMPCRNHFCPVPVYLRHLGNHQETTHIAQLSAAAGTINGPPCTDSKDPYSACSARCCGIIFPEIIRADVLAKTTHSSSIWVSGFSCKAPAVE